MPHDPAQGSGHWLAHWHVHVDWHPICVGMALEQEAALEKARAGEGRNVEHVALETKGTLKLAASQSTAGERGIFGSAPQSAESWPYSFINPSQHSRKLISWRCSIRQPALARREEELETLYMWQSSSCQQHSICHNLCWIYFSFNALVRPQRIGSEPHYGGPRSSACMGLFFLSPFASVNGTSFLCQHACPDANVSGTGTKRSPRRGAAAKVKKEASAAHATGELKDSKVPAAEPVTAGGKLTMHKRRTASGPGRSTRSKVAAQSEGARGIGLDVPYRWGNPQL